MSNTEFKTFTFNGESKIQRIDLWLTAQMPEFTRTYIQKLIKDENVKIGKKVIKSNYKLFDQDIVNVAIPPAKDDKPKPQDIPLNIIYEDEDIIVINKPVGIIVHPTPGNDENTLVNAMLYHCKDLSGIGGIKRPGIVHRLDKDTSGVMLAAKNDFAHQSISKQLLDRTVEKTYLAFIKGTLPEQHLLINKPIGRSRSNRMLMRVDGMKKRSALTEVFEIADYSFISLIRILLHTGRTHQIRVHLSDMQHPVIGDVAYGFSDKDFNSQVPQEYKIAFLPVIAKINRQMLHAYKIKIVHPKTNEVMEFTADLPDDMKSIMNVLNINSLAI